MYRSKAPGTPTPLVLRGKRGRGDQDATARAEAEAAASQQSTIALTVAFIWDDGETTQPILVEQLRASGPAVQPGQTINLTIPLDALKVIAKLAPVLGYAKTEAQAPAKLWTPKRD